MNPVSDVVAESSSYKWEDEVGWIFINLFKDGKIVRKIDYDSKPLKLEVKSKRDFNGIGFEFLDGKSMTFSGFPVEEIRQRVEAFYKYDKLDFYLYDSDGNFVRYSNWLVDDDEDEVDHEPFDFEDCDEIDVDYVVIKFRNPKYIVSSDEESDEEEEG